MELVRLGAGSTQAKLDAPQAAELILHAAYLTEARGVSEPTFTKVATLAGELRLERPQSQPVFICDPGSDFTYVEPEPTDDEPIRRLPLAYDANSFFDAPPDGAPARSLRLPKEPEGSRFLELAAELQIAGAVEAPLASNHRLDVPLGPLEALVTSLPLDQLTGAARLFTPQHFVAWLTMIFGEDIPHPAYLRLRSELFSGAYRMPRIRVVSSLDGDFVAGYDRTTKEIKVKRAFVRSAETDPDEAMRLVAALVEEFGHFVDDDLRTRLSKVGGDAQFDEGALFGYSVLNLGFDLAERADYAVYLRDGEPVTLQVEWPEFKKSIEQTLGPEEQRSDDMSVAIEFFGAGEGDAGKPRQSFAHESIEFVLKPIFQNDPLVKQIYFGNWLRDYSQGITKMSLDVLAAGAKYVNDALPGKAPGIPRLVSDPRGVITEILDIYARAKFADVPQFRVTKARLGVYRAEEHIDNPTGLTPSAIEPTLNRAPTGLQTNIDLLTQQAGYIASTLPPPEVSALQYMRGEFLAAMAAGPTAEGCRRLGAGLHTLEDFYAHSNFCELGLRAAGKTTVEPWVPAMKSGSKTFFPLVTGMFGGDDTAASIFLGIGEILEKEIGQKCIAGKRSTGVSIALVIMRDLRPHIHARADATLKRFEALQQAHPVIAVASCATIGLVIRFAHFLIGTVIRLLANQIDEIQLKLKPGTTINPTHTQIAKDHDDHPLHVLAATCAEIAVTDIGRRMKDIWDNGVTPGRRDALLSRAGLYFQHPEFLFTGPQTNELTLIVDRINGFANDPANAAAIARASTKSALDSHLTEAKEFADRATKNFSLERLKQLFGLLGL